MKNQEEKGKWRSGVKKHGLRSISREKRIMTQTRTEFKPATYLA